MSKDKVSVIVPIYNTRAEFLNKCMETIINQTYSDIEIILIDDGSREETADICDEWKKIDTRITVIHKKNEGVSEARNTGIAVASGKWITFVDSDDWIELNAIERLVAEADGCDVIIARDFIDDEKQLTLNNDIYLVSNEHYEMISNLLLDKPNIRTLGAVWGKLYSREIIVSNKIQFSKRLKMGEDYLFNFEFFLHVEKAKYILDYLFHYRDDNNNSVTRRYDNKLIEKYNLLFEEFEKKLSKKENSILKEAYYVFVIRTLDYFYFLSLYAYNNTLNNEERIKIIRDVSNLYIYNRAIKNVNLKLLSRGKKVVVILLRKKLYKILDWILDKKRRYICKKN